MSTLNTPTINFSISDYDANAATFVINQLIIFFSSDIPLPSIRSSQISILDQYLTLDDGKIVLQDEVQIKNSKLTGKALIIKAINPYGYGLKGETYGDSAAPENVAATAYFKLFWRNMETNKDLDEGRINIVVTDGYVTYILIY